MATVGDVLVHTKKQHGAKIGDYGTGLHAAARSPTDIYELDMALGGGWPQGKIVEIFGLESSGKTNAVLKSIATYQKLNPTKTCVFIDVEHALDGIWARKLGVDTDKLLWMKPEYVEQIIDMVEGFLEASDIGLIAIDSIAAMITLNESIKDASVAAVGGSSALIGKLIRKCTLRLTQAEKEGRFPIVMLVNQTRFKIGTGPRQDPETTPGGNAPRFAAAIRLRTYGRNVEDAKVSTVMPVRKETQFIIRKWKCPILSTHGKYEMAMIEHDGLDIGRTDDVSTVMGYLQKCKMLEKGKAPSTWVLDGETYKTQEPIKKRLVEDKLWGIGMRAKTIKIMLAGGEIEETGENGPPPEPEEAA